MRRSLSFFCAIFMSLFAVSEASFADTTKPDTYGFRAADVKPGTATTVLQILQKAESTRSISTALADLKDIPSITRWRGSTKGDVVRIYSFHHTSGDNPRHVNIKPDEVARELHIAEQFRDLIKVANGLTATLSGGTEEIAVTHTDYVL